MLLQDAISLRILELAKENHLTLNQLAERSGLSASSITRTVHHNNRVGNTSTATIYKICVGLNIRLVDFWASPLFDDLETEEEK